VDDEREPRLKVPYQLVIHGHQLAALALGQSHVQTIVKGPFGTLLVVYENRQVSSGVRM
jgi:hypothetical protein